MTAIAILEGCNLGMDYSNDVDLLGWGMPKIFRPSTYKKIARKVTRPIKKVLAPVTRPLDRMLKKIPVVRTLYKARIATHYASTLRPKEAWKAAKRTGKSAYKDFKGAKKIILKLAMKVVKPLAKKGVSKGIAKVTAIPTVTAMASSAVGPWAIGLVPLSVSKAIDIVWKQIKKVAKKIMPKKASLVRIAKRFTGGGKKYDAMKMLSIPSVKAPGRKRKKKKVLKKKAQPKKAGAGLLMLAPLALMLGAM